MNQLTFRIESTRCVGVPQKLLHTGTFGFLASEAITWLQQAAGSLAGFFGSVVPAELVDVPSIALDRSLRRFLGRHGLQSALLGYRGYPAHCSVSPNDVAVHGIPSARRLCRGDVFTVDIAAAGGGWLTDSAWTFLMPGAPRRSEDEYRAAWCAFQAVVAAIREVLKPNVCADQSPIIAAWILYSPPEHYLLYSFVRKAAACVGMPWHETRLQQAAD